MQTRPLDSGSLTHGLKNRLVSHVVVNGMQQLTINFSDGTVLIVEASSNGLVTRVVSVTTPPAQATPHDPTKRQLEYLAFIAKYIDRFGRAPAEADIERHFFVSAPTVNQMMQMLERRGFITRERGVPRSTRICIDLTKHGALDVAR